MRPVGVERRVATAIRAACSGGKPIDARGDRREGERAHTELIGDLQAAAIAGGQHRCLPLTTALPDLTDGVDDVAHRRVQITRRRRHRITGRTRRKHRTRRSQPWPRYPMDGTIHTTTHQRLVRCGHHRVHVLPGDITHDHLDRHHNRILPPPQGRADPTGTVTLFARREPTSPAHARTATRNAAEEDVAPGDSPCMTMRWVCSC